MRVRAIRVVMIIRAIFYHRASPRGPAASFTIKIPSRIALKSHSFNLIFYVPDAYHNAPSSTRFPVVVNYHGGGFVLGRGTDDARWAGSVLEQIEAVVVSVEYGLAPEYGFSTGLEDSTDAVLYLAAHASELRLDPHRIALSGFSAGGNLTFTVPFVIRDLQLGVNKRSIQGEPAYEVPPLTICCLVAMYPPTDFRVSRIEKRATNSKPELNLPPRLTNLIDESVLNPAYTTCQLDTADPYLSPITATDSMIRDAYPRSIVLYVCEYDMLYGEGIKFDDRLKSKAVGKDVKGGVVEKAPHGFDKQLKFFEATKRCYDVACDELKVSFGLQTKENRVQLDISKNIDSFDDSGRNDVRKRTG